MRHITGIMIHCLATSQGWAEDKTIEEIVKEVTNWHVHERGWIDIGYHAGFHYDGSFAIGRDLDHDGDAWEHVGAGAKGFNKEWIHLFLVGGKGSAATDDPSDHYTGPQLAALRAKIEELKQRFPTITQVIGHNEVAAKACPGFHVPTWYNKRTPRTVTGSTTLRATGSAGAATVGTAATMIPALDGNVQIIVAVFLGIIALSLLWIMRERIKKWARGIR